MSYVVDGAVEPRFGKLMVWLAEATGTKLTEGRIRSYAQDLNDVPWDALTRACALARRDCAFFPALPEIRKHLGQQPTRQQALVAWAALSRAAAEVGAWATLEVEDPRAAHALRVVFGSWPAFCETDDGPALAQQRQEFLAAYEAAAMAQREALRLPGRCELSGRYPEADQAPRVWLARVTRSGLVEARRERPALAGVNRPELPPAEVVDAD